MKKMTRKRVVKATALSSAVLLGLAAGSALAAPADHSAIVLKNAAGQAIKATDTTGNAFSMKTTCFTANCHNDGTNANGGGNAAYTYNQIEAHSYHAQLGANEMRGFNPWNPDATLANGLPDKWRRGAGPVGKNWVQNPGHVGSW